MPKKSAGGQIAKLFESQRQADPIRGEIYDNHRSKTLPIFGHCRGIVVATIMLTFFINPREAQAAAGDLDPTFGVGGKTTTDLNRSTDIANAVAVQSDGKLVVVGQAYKHNDYSDEDFVVTRYNTNGTLDTTIGRGGKARTDFPGLAAVPSAVVIEPDGKIVVAGGVFPLFTFLRDFKVVRYNPNGSLDTSFGSNGCHNNFSRRWQLRVRRSFAG